MLPLAIVVVNGAATTAGAGWVTIAGVAAAGGGVVSAFAGVGGVDDSAAALSDSMIAMTLPISTTSST